VKAVEASSEVRSATAGTGGSWRCGPRRLFHGHGGVDRETRLSRCGSERLAAIVMKEVPDIMNKIR